MKTFYGKRSSIQVDPIELSKITPKLPIDRGKTLDAKLYLTESELPDWLHRNKLDENHSGLRAINYTNTIKSKYNIYRNLDSDNSVFGWTPEKKSNQFQIKIDSRQVESEEKKRGLNASLQSRNAFGNNLIFQWFDINKTMKFLSN